MRGGRYASMDFCKGEGVKEGEGRKYSPSSTHFTEKNAISIQRSLVRPGLKGSVLLLVNRGFMCITCQR